MKAPIYEIFSSWQGEGLFAGARQIFVRFSGCNLSCSYCDEPAASGKGAVMTPEESARKIEKLAEFSSSRFISFTGGEPLLYADFIKALIKRLGRGKFRFFLETNGTLPEELGKIARLVDVISMDIKLPSFCRKKNWEAHKKFLKAAGRKAYVKIVVSPRTPPEEFRKGVELVSAAGREIPFFIQPESSVFVRSSSGRGFGPYEEFYGIAASKLSDVSVLPQLHRLWGIK